MARSLVWLLISFVATCTSRSPPVSTPTARLDDATFRGTFDGVANRFLGIPFAKPPTGDLRFRLPVPNSPYTGNVDATQFGSPCSQQLTNITIPDTLSKNVSDVITGLTGRIFSPMPGSENCLFLNVFAPPQANTKSNLPVVMWIPGGGFEIGTGSTFNGSAVVERSLQLGEPVIYVSINYRLNGFGFLPGKEVKAAGVGNLGLQDQRQALRWIQTYIRAFGGDPTRVTLWGESAGAFSVAMQLFAYDGNTEGLYRGAIMESGTYVPFGDITDGQKYYDALIEQTGCSTSTDTLGCLRTVPYEQLSIAINSSPSIMSYQSIILAWLPRVDGVFLPSTFQRALLEGKVANVPLITGDVEDEGSIFSISALNVSTDGDFRNYVRNVFFPSGSEKDIDTIARLYPEDPTLGCPFGTGLQGAFTPQYKRISAFIGDLIFLGPRRVFSQVLSERQKVWSLLFKRGKTATPFGAQHGSDLRTVYQPGDLTDNVLNFVNHLDPNGRHFDRGAITWPQYTKKSPQLLTFLDGPKPQIITQDTFRAEPISFLANLTLAHPLGGQ